MADFLDYMLDFYPVVSQIKGIVHFACGDNEKGCKSLTSSIRTIAVLGAGAMGEKAAGPAGVVVAAVGAGIFYDSLAADKSDGGQTIKGVMKIVNNPSELTAWISGGIDVTIDVLFGFFFVGCVGAVSFPGRDSSTSFFCFQVSSGVLLNNPNITYE